MKTTRPIGDTGSVKEAFNIARRLVGEGHKHLAIVQLEAILEAEQDEVNALCLLGSLRSTEARYAEAIVLLQRAWSLEPGFFDAALELARIKRLSGDPEGGIEVLRALTVRAPGHSRAWQSLGDCLCEAGQIESGLEAFRRSVATDPFRLEIVRAIEALNDGRKHDAEAILRHVLENDPNHLHALVGLASVALDAGVTTDAEYLLERARRLSPYSDVVWRNIARVHSERADYELAERAARCAVDLNPKSPDAWSMLGNVQAGGLRPELARESFQTSLDLSSLQPRVWLSLGHVCKTIGERDASERAYRTAIKQAPTLGEAFWSLADLKNYRFTTAEFDAMSTALEQGQLTQTDRAAFHFAIAKYYEDGREFADAFENYDAGNKIKSGIDAFDSQGFSEACREVASVLSKPMLSKAPGAGQRGQPVPIFIVGLPRAGSTLVEQILASHSEVQGTMELPHILNYVRQLRSGNGYPDAVRNMNDEDFSRLGQRYLDETEPFRGTADHFVDKMPNNFLHIGLIARILPQSIFIDARRDPRDCCLSAFKQNFARGQAFSYSLPNLGQYFRDYLQIMQHWDNVLPGRVLHVQYESVVADTEYQIRRLLAHCDLEFEDACLNFHKTRRSVRTASAEQVRQPIYANSVGHWENFETWLAPLIDALGDAVPGPH
jgi:tetratricopeptide (TPR) repeat protein